MKGEQRQANEIGLNGRRVQMINLTAAMGGQFARVAAEMTAEIKGIGPNPLGRERTEMKLSMTYKCKEQMLNV